MKKGIDFTGVSVIFACHDGAGNFLFAKRGINCRDEHGRWDPGSGAIEFGDSPEQTLDKEIHEEYLTERLAIQFLGYRSVLRTMTEGPSHWIALDFKVLVRRDKAGNGEPHKFDEVSWFRLDALPSPMHSQWPAFLAKYSNELLRG